MAKFTVRIELHKASADDYSDLHEAMEAGGFSRQIKSGDGVFYHLPTAEYRYASDTETAAQVRDRAVGIAKDIRPKPAVLVSEAVSTAWSGLDKVN